MQHDAAWHERQYNPRLTVANAADIVAGWSDRARRTRQRHPCLADLPYGPHPREVIDIFRVENPRGAVIYIHGGYWRMLSKFETSWVADAFLDQGLSVALINYPLCPEVTVAGIRLSVARAVAHLSGSLLTEAERARIAVVGHSAGGHLAASLLTVPWSAQPFAGVVSVSGVFDVAPLIPTSMNADIRLDAAQAQALDLNGVPPLNPAPLLLAVGEVEPEEFHRQSAALAESWRTPRRLTLQGANHFTAIDSLAVQGGVLNDAVLGMLGG